jgi:superfamily II DNA or RNA helicase
MAAFTEFLSTFDPDAGKRGRQFEHFVKWFLKNDPTWATQVEEVWLWSDYPGNWGRDKGIDLVFKDRSGKTWAVQAKCYSSNYEITKADVDTFLSESNRKHIDHRLLIATTDGLGVNGREVLDGQEKPVVRFLLNHFEDSALDYPVSIEHLLAAKRKTQPTPRPHQIEALDNIVSGFATSDRGQVVMACGTGKTFVCLWARERLKARRTLVLLPSLGLLSQTLSEWTYASSERFDVLCVCSDQTVGRRDADEAFSSASELGFPVSSDPSEIAEFLRQESEQVIFSTYQSSPLIAAAQSDLRIPRLDLVIADEAHRCVGKSDTAFHTVLDDSQIRADKRLFATATPRVYKTSLKKAAQDFGVEVVDMNDEQRFGRRFHTLSFGEAIKRELLTDYRVLIVGVDNERIAEWIESRRLVATEAGHETDAQSLAAQIGLLKAIKDWNLRRLISFHGRIKRAKEFSEDITQVSAWLDEQHKPTARLWADYVSGEMTTVTRKRKLQKLKSVGSEEVGLLANARCLSEGVDVPALDGVAFIDPRGSEIDIIQSVGRAIRLSKDKTMGTIVIPVFIEQSEDAKEALESSNFKPIWYVLEALKSHDERLSDELDELRVALGENRNRGVGTNDLMKIIFDLPTAVDETFAEYLRVHLVEQTTEAWMFWYGLLKQYAEEFGHCLVPHAYKTSDGYKLGYWIRNQRADREIMTLDRRERLEELADWSWNTWSDAWETGFKQLQAFADREGHCRVPVAYKTSNGYKLGQWINVQRTNKAKLDLLRRQRLEALPRWSWDALADAWEEGFEHLKAFSHREGHCRVLQTFQTSEGYKLGSWVSNQRTKKDTIDADRRQRLEALPRWSWDTLSDAWEEGFEYLKAFAAREGHCRVPSAHKASSGYKLGSWVSNQRTKKDTVDADRRQRLEALPRWSWDTLSDAWEEGFEYLKAFAAREGHCRVKDRETTEDGYRLGTWVVTQRSRRDSMPVDRRDRLERLPSWIWDVSSSLWEEGFEHLKAFAEREGHCRVKDTYKSEDDYRLGAWVVRQRSGRDSMAADRRDRLEGLRGWIWDVFSSSWDEGFEHLSAFSDREHHCLVPQQYTSDDGYKLGSWVSQQRSTKETIGVERRQRLEALPRWTWDAVTESWNIGFDHLKAYAEREGHCRVKDKYKTEDGYLLGRWISFQRRQKDKMNLDRRNRLESLPGWHW